MRTTINPAYVILFVVAIHASLLFAQEQAEPGPPEAPLGLEAQEDDPRWWTLTDEITPQELRAMHEDVELNKERYREAVRAGTREWWPMERTEPPSFFIDGSTHPELFQMRSVFDAFAIAIDSEMADRRASLAEFGFEGEGLEKIVHFSSEYWRERQVLMEKAKAEVQPVLEFYRLGRERLGEDSFKAASEAEDVTTLALATGYSIEEIEELWEIRKRTPGSDFSAQALPLLKELLGPTDWHRFRSYLLEVTAPMMSSMSTAVN